MVVESTTINSMGKKRNSIIWYLIIIYFITLIVPILVLANKPSFTICSFFDYLKDFSFTVWVLLFSCSWLYYKQIIKANEHLRVLVNQSIDANETNVVRQAKTERNKSLEPNISRLNNAELAIKSLETAIAIVGILAGVIGIISFVCKSIIDK